MQLQKVVAEVAAQQCLGLGARINVLAFEAESESTDLDPRKLGTIRDVLAKLSHPKLLSVCESLKDEVAKWKAACSQKDQMLRRKAVANLSEDDKKLGETWQNQMASIKATAGGNWPIAQRARESSLESLRAEFGDLSVASLAASYKMAVEMHTAAKTMPPQKLSSLLPSLPEPIISELESVVQELKILLGIQSGFLARLVLLICF